MSNNETPGAPKIFDHVERYVSNLPAERVKWIREAALSILKIERISPDEEILAGYILELTN